MTPDADQLKVPGMAPTIYDQACGTGGMAPEEPALWLEQESGARLGPTLEPA